MSIATTIAKKVSSGKVYPKSPSSCCREGNTCRVLPPNAVGIFVCVGRGIARTTVIHSVVVTSRTGTTTISRLLLKDYCSRRVTANSNASKVIVTSTVRKRLALASTSKRSGLKRLVNETIHVTMGRTLVGRATTYNPERFRILIHANECKVAPKAL